MCEGLKKNVNNIKKITWYGLSPTTWTSIQWFFNVPALSLVAAIEHSGVCVCGGVLLF